MAKIIRPPALCIGLGRIVSWTRPLIKIANVINGLQLAAGLWDGSGEVFLTAKRSAVLAWVRCSYLLCSRRECPAPRAAPAPAFPIAPPITAPFAAPSALACLGCCCGWVCVAGGAVVGGACADAWGTSAMVNERAIPNDKSLGTKQQRMGAREL